MRGRQGFTLIEVLFVIALMAVLFAVMSPYMGAFHTSWQKADRRSQVIQNARIGMDKMVREFRQAAGFSMIQASTATFTDVDGNIVSYRLNGGYLQRNSVNLAGPVSSLAFTYYDLAGAITAVAANVRSVSASLTVTDPEAGGNSMLLSSNAYVRSTPSAVTGEGHQYSKNADFSTSDTSFSRSDTFYVKIWSDVIDYNNIATSTVRLKKGSTINWVTLTNNMDGTFTGSQALSGFATGTWQVKIDISDTAGNSYSATDTLEIIA